MWEISSKEVIEEVDHFKSVSCFLEVFTSESQKWSV